MPERVSDSGRGVPPSHPFLLNVATRLLAKADRSEVQRGVRLKLDRRTAPELFGQVDAEELRRLELLLDELCATSWVRLVLAKPREFAGFLDRNPRLELLDFEALRAWAGFARRSDHWSRQLVSHLDVHWPFPPEIDKRALLDYLGRSPLSALAEVSADEAVRSLVALRCLCESHDRMALREASARVFLGHSKVLDSRDELLRLLGAAPGQFLEAPIQLLVDIPASFDAALFVENLVTFEHMADCRRPAWEHSLLVYSAGFKGSGKRLRSREGCRLYVRPTHGESLTFATDSETGLRRVAAWLFDKAPLPVRFFGDLDFAGMQILATLRDVFPDAGAWEPGYTVLAAQLAAGGGHLPELASKERQTDPSTTGCRYADSELLPLMRRVGRFVDQEAFGSSSQSQA